MIGNLFNAVSIALFSGCLALGGVQADSNPLVNVTNVHNNVVIGRSKSRINTLENIDVFVPAIDCYDSVHFNDGDNLLFNHFYQLGGYDFSNEYWFDNSYDGSFEYLRNVLHLNNNYSCAFGFDVWGEDVSLPGSSPIRQYYARLRVGSKNDILVWDDWQYIIDSFEFKVDAYYRLDGESSSTNITSLSNFTFKVDNHTISDKTLYYGCTANTFLGDDAVDVSLYYFDLLFKIDTIGLSSDIVSYGFSIQGRWYCNFKGMVGYMQGYNNGYVIGYNNGYSVGSSSVAPNVNFTSLFNAIADTPLRFLYGLFNFDLFGTSVIIIVLSLLTGIIVFGLVKKFWK